VMVGLVPVLMEQMADGYMKDRFCAYMEDKISRARADIKRFKSDRARKAVARYWLELFEANYKAYTNDFYRDILGTLKWLQDEGAIEVLTSAATHAFLPLLERDSAVFAQVRLGIETYQRYFQRAPRGFWLPECAYRPAEWSQQEKRQRQGLDAWLAREGIEYFFVEHVGIERASFVDNRHQEQAATTYRGYGLASGVSVFGRNQATGQQVWSPDQGSPGDPAYLEFHRKDPESGLRYWRVTGQMNKQLYDVEASRRRVQIQARHFVNLIKQLPDKADTPGVEPLIVAPYDCELFGHWWHEGVAWLEQVYRLLAEEKSVACLSLSEYHDPDVFQHLGPQFRLHGLAEPRAQLDLALYQLQLPRGGAGAGAGPAPG
jgi:1,4-alpha-glucan branching enzyme